MESQTKVAFMEPARALHDFYDSLAKLANSRTGTLELSVTADELISAVRDFQIDTGLALEHMPSAMIDLYTTAKSTPHGHFMLKQVAAAVGAAAKDV